MVYNTYITGCSVIKVIILWASLLPPSLLPPGDLCPGVGAADDGAKRYQEYVVEAMASVVTSGVLDAVEMFAKGCIGCVGHGVTS